jgi:predicted Rossmann fold flavoprotein
VENGRKKSSDVLHMRIADVVIVGAGGAGMMCAIQAAKRRRRVLLIDHAQKIGRKILISGGGRCNFTNIHTSPDSFVSKNPHFCKSALSRFTPEDFITMVKAHGIAFHEKKLGQLFCNGSAQNILDMLVNECTTAGASFDTDCQIKSIHKNTGFILETNHGSIAAESLVIASGGLSIPQIGATGFGYEIAKQFGLAIVPTAPALDGFNFNQEDLNRFRDLPGVSIDTVVKCNGAAFRENILFTHTGLSGPASLQASLYWHSGDPLIIDLMPEQNVYAQLTGEIETSTKLDVKNVLAEYLPKRFADKFCQINSISGKVAQVPLKQLADFCSLLHSWTIFPSGTVGYRKAEVTRGGVDTEELSSKTMQARKVPGLYFVGEVVDVTGQLGGYNFQWAWASGYAAGQYV